MLDLCLCIVLLGRPASSHTRPVKIVPGLLRDPSHNTWIGRTMHQTPANVCGLRQGKDNPTDVLSTCKDGSISMSSLAGTQTVTPGLHRLTNSDASHIQDL